MLPVGDPTATDVVLSRAGVAVAPNRDGDYSRSRDLRHDTPRGSVTPWW